MVETTEGNAGNGADQPRRARSSTERSRAHRAKKKLEREAALQKANAERQAALQAEAARVAEAVAGVADAVASTENTVAGAAPGPAEPKAEREAAALHEAGEAEREAGATETATIERVAGRVADVAGTVAPGFREATAFSAPEWRILWHPAQPPIVPAFFRWPDVQPPAHDAHPVACPARPVAHPAGWFRLAFRHSVTEWCRRTFGGMSVLLSFALYFISTFLNMTFWANLNPDATAKEILAAGGLVAELINYAIPSALSHVPSSQRMLRLVLRVVLSVTMIVTAIAGASVVKNSLGASHESRKQTIEARDRLQGIVNSVVAPISDASVVAAREKRDAAKAVAQIDCPKNKSLDVEICNKSRAAWLKAADDFTHANEKHDADVRDAKEQHRKAVADAQVKLDGISVISLDLDMAAAGVEAIVPGVPEAWVTRIVVLLWVLLFSLGPCTLLRSGLEILAPARTTPCRSA
jgi:hypothetical protein